MKMRSYYSCFLIKYKDIIIISQLFPLKRQFMAIKKKSQVFDIQITIVRRVSSYLTTVFTYYDQVLVKY